MASSFPDGIGEQHMAPAGGGERHAGALSILVLGGLIVLALLGIFGGVPAQTKVAETADARLSVSAPRVMRNGIFFEMRIAVSAKRDVSKLVLAVPPGLWRDMTINSQIPAAEAESFTQGAFRFDYGALPRGSTIEIKLDGQINPPLFAGTEGSVSVLDGDRPIASVPLKIRVLP